MSLMNPAHNHISREAEAEPDRIPRVALIKLDQDLAARRRRTVSSLATGIIKQARFRPHFLYMTRAVRNTDPYPLPAFRVLVFDDYASCSTLHCSILVDQPPLREISLCIPAEEMLFRA